MRICQCELPKRANTVDPEWPLKNSCDDCWTWDVDEKNDSIRVYGSYGRSVLFHSDWSNGTVGVRGNRPLSGGRFYWEIDVSHRVFGTSLMFGIGSKRTSMQEYCFVNLIGQDQYSWGLNHKGVIYHAGNGVQYTEPFLEYTPTTVGVLFDSDEGTLTFFKDGVNLGLAFRGVKCSEGLYPMISSTAARTEMTLSIARRTFLSLEDRCYSTLVRQLNSEQDVDKLELPPWMRQELKSRQWWALR
ncbi:SPRY domain-containing SOCS box protein 3 [Trichinella nelsoni]|uniref:SPRY domain-containing SOCS box protein 3 n=4 Tax=Trichinella TaxID=6333 RepID=A0A0V1LS84_9BILA|nr:SPRY domain-containing SOCS box protein 3 [Trichinella nelsoni]KRX46465.1 SPRY domain-containing SOCS box protein 3 [Trichinella murrelli]KRX58776.1 SPRY domain-containing SOCS box protein 3 [Trichinella sp. T9]KRX81018.1 SPRY domain-containing SOCS box protein 3 [Trichinella sp. T6]KRY08986.1 SPRY domain-containing SOCS box protein 3 [Trichinella patagoniensis]KRZ62378.1 SPRY domain-containing SOCS box protein 3 [Trichinella nativa]KRZ87181.1 SPRY domain-containing SOCS box protein 3 [Tri